METGIRLLRWISQSG